MPSFVILSLAALLVVIGLIVAGFVAYAVVRYTPVIARIFEEKPVFLPLRVDPKPDGEEVGFASNDGIELAGTYYRAPTSRRAGVIVFCHEYLSDRWSFRPYTDPLGDLGYDIFTFDFRNHGQSGSDPDYRPTQWVTGHEVGDLRSALAYLRSRPDRDPAGCLLFGISRGGSTALCAAAEEPSVWGVITDGAFPIWGTMLAYIKRWSEIYVGSPRLWKIMPRRLFEPLAWTLGWAARRRTERRFGCRYESVERAVRRLAPRPWLMIHGQKDAYILPEIAIQMFEKAGDPKEHWIVPGAKHNRCLEVARDAYHARLVDFVGRFGPIRRLPTSESPSGSIDAPTVDDADLVAGSPVVPFSTSVAG